MNTERPLIQIARAIPCQPQETHLSKQIPIAQERLAICMHEHWLRCGHPNIGIGQNISGKTCIHAPVSDLTFFPSHMNVHMCLIYDLSLRIYALVSLMYAPPIQTRFIFMFHRPVFVKFLIKHTMVEYQSNQTGDLQLIPFVLRILTRSYAHARPTVFNLGCGKHARLPAICCLAG